MLPFLLASGSQWLAGRGWAQGLDARIAKGPVAQHPQEAGLFGECVSMRVGVSVCECVWVCTVCIYGGCVQDACNVWVAMGV